ncbi:MAG: cytochrome c oxidase subunit II [Candidatus Latescibacterota bacterium]|nr:cytochrome c oxidase subunit II [Candidatus Latescibacterota bacterium]
MSENFPLFPEQASTFAWQVDYLYFLLLALSAFFAVAIFFFLVLFSFKYRRRSEDERPRPSEDSIAMEVTWSIIPLILSLAVFALGAGVFFRMYRAPENAIDIYVVGKQWMWKVQHPEGKREINELHVPVNQPVRLTLASEDVIHAFSVPAFRIKRDVVPGRYNTMWFEATKAGEYRLFCAEYCGTQHSGMTGRVVVMEQDEFQNWLSGGASGETMVEAGARQFQQLGCETCHKESGQGRGPKLSGVYGHTVELTTGQEVVADEDYLRSSILDPGSQVVVGYKPIMPTFQGQLSEETLMQIISYLQSLE